MPRCTYYTAGIPCPEPGAPRPHRFDRVLCDGCEKKVSDTLADRINDERRMTRRVGDARIFAG